MSWKRVDNKEEGVCPYCNSMEIDYDVLQHLDNCVYYPVTCYNCGKHYREYYFLDFDGIYEKEEENEV